LNTSKDARKRHNMNYETPPKFRINMYNSNKNHINNKNSSFPIA
jgi:hypothetical protein